MATKKILTDLDIDGNITGDSFVKDGGTSSQFLKADGSVDSNSYVTSASIPTATSDLTNDSGFITDGNTNWNNSYGFITSSSLPTNVSDLTNDAGYITSYVDTNTQRSDEEIRDIASAQWINGTNTTVVKDDNANTIKINSVNTNTQLSDADIAAMGYIKTDNDTQDLSISGQILSLTNGGSVTLPDTNTQRSDSEIQAIIDANSAGFITSETDSQTLSISSNEISISNGNTITLYDQTLNKADNVEFNDITADKTYLDPDSTGGFQIGKTLTAYASDATATGNQAGIWNQVISTPTSTGSAYISGLVNMAKYEGTNIVGSMAASDNYSRYQGSGGISGGLYGTTGQASYRGTDASSNNGANVTVQGVYGLAEAQSGATGDIEYMIGGNVLSKLDASGVDVQYLQGAHITTAISNGEVTGDVTVAIFDMDQTGGTISGGFEYLRIQNDSVTSTGTARAINSLSTLPSRFSGSMEATSFVKTGGTSSQFLKADGSVDTNTYLTSYTDTNTQRTDEEIRDLAAGQWINGTNTTVVFDDNANTIKINSVDTNTQLSDGDIAAFGYIKTYTDTNTQRDIHDTPVNGATTISISSNWAFDNVKTAVPSGALFTDTNTQLTDSQIAAMGYIKTESDNQSLSISGQTLSLTNGGSVTLPDTNTQRSDAEIEAIVEGYGYITDGNTNWNNSYGFITSSSLPTATSDLTNDSGFITSASLPTATSDLTNDSGFITDGNTNWNNSYGFITSSSLPTNVSELTNDSGYITSYTDTQRSDEEIRDVAAAQWINGTNTTVVKDDGANTIKINSVNTQLSDADIAAMGYIKTDTDTQDLSISGQILSLTNGGSVTLPDTNTQLSDADIAAFGYIKTYTDTNTQLSDSDVGAFGYIKDYTVTEADVTQHEAALSIAYSQLTGTPTLAPSNAEQNVQSDWNAVSGDAFILNKPTLFDGAYSSLSGLPTLFDGAYSSLSGLPTLAPSNAEQNVQSDWNATTGDAFIQNKPTLFSGSYDDLTDKPTIPSITGKLDNTTDTLTGTLTVTVDVIADRLESSSSIQMGDDTDTASSSNVGSMRYRTTSTHSYADMCMNTGTNLYEWVNIVAVQFPLP